MFFGGNPGEFGSQVAETSLRALRRRSGRTDNIVDVVAVLSVLLSLPKYELGEAFRDR
jgi:hypothetical protein